MSRYQKTPQAATITTKTPFTPVGDIYDPEGTKRFYVVQQTETVRYADSGKIKAQGTRYYIMDRKTGELYSDPKKGVQAYQNDVSCYIVANRLTAEDNKNTQ